MRRKVFAFLLFAQLLWPGAASALPFKTDCKRPVIDILDEETKRKKYSQDILSSRSADAESKLRNCFVHRLKPAISPNLDKTVTASSMTSEKIPEGKAIKFLVRDNGTTNCVAILNLEDDGSASLNPVGFDYGVMPALKGLQKAQAEELWAKDWPVSANLRQVNTETFELTALGNQAIKNSQTTVFLDTVFENEQLLRYRLRASFIASPNWKLAR